MKIDAVFSGGGVKAYAFLGALKSLESNQFQIERVAGTSAGAILASFVAAGYTSSDMLQLLQQTDLKALLDPPKPTTFLPGTKWFFLYFQMGLYKGDKLEKWLYNHLANQGIYTFSDLPNGCLKVVASDLSLGKLIVIPDDLYRVYGINPAHFPVSKAVRMSAGFPYFFMPKKLPGKAKQKSIMVDGGLLSNFPLWLFTNSNNREQRPVLGVKLSDTPANTTPHDIKNALDMLHALFATMKQAHDARYISTTDKKNIIFIPVKNIETTNFQINANEIDMLLTLGMERTDQFLKHWPK
ncbi:MULTISPECIES: patatin-like phospholipase family protein [unclassified Virgibacillus]|uniref:patatin-like phospholipase family protein n=1 Tax=unclassified Virgibacillus TaxID=2620237 RepID=UPI0024DE450A|nr:patatin-like phospholipase family protein [Virgibacillus sp. LDC-1]